MTFSEKLKEAINPPSEAEKFFNLTKGKKIRWSGWDEDKYFIPEVFHKPNSMSGYNNFKTYSVATQKWVIVNGFNKPLGGECWVKVGW